jgi:Zn-dependent alcohol dehydrogenase
MLFRKEREVAMKAAVCYEFGEPLVVEELEIDPPQQGEVRVRMAAAAICHSDIHLIKGDWGGETPVVAGHEASGVWPLFLLYDRCPLQL